MRKCCLDANGRKSNDPNIDDGDDDADSELTRMMMMMMMVILSQLPNAWNQCCSICYICERFISLSSSSSSSSPSSSSRLTYPLTVPQSWCIVIFSLWKYALKMLEWVELFGWLMRMMMMITMTIVSSYFNNDDGMAVLSHKHLWEASDFNSSFLTILAIVLKAGLAA